MFCGTLPSSLDTFSFWPLVYHYWSSIGSCTGESRTPCSPSGSLTPSPCSRWCLAPKLTSLGIKSGPTSLPLSSATTGRGWTGISCGLRCSTPHFRQPTPPNSCSKTMSRRYQPSVSFRSLFQNTVLSNSNQIGTYIWRESRNLCF